MNLLMAFLQSQARAYWFWIRFAAALFIAAAGAAFLGNAIAWILKLFNIDVSEYLGPPCLASFSNWDS